jgi:ArsR family transcriptional regulator
MLNTMLSTKDERLIHSLQALGDTTRYKMFKILQENNELCVGEIADRLQISSSAVSQHFRTFELIGLVKKQRSGQKVCYTLNKDDVLANKLIALTDG